MAPVFLASRHRAAGCLETCGLLRGKLICTCLSGREHAVEFIEGFLGGNMRRAMRITVAMVGVLAILFVSGMSTRPDDRAQLLKVRESVWRSWFANDTKTLEALVPPDTIVISAGEEKWKNQADILESAAKFHA